MILDYLKTVPQFLLPKRLLTVLAGVLADVRMPMVKNVLIRHFIRSYGVDMTEALEEVPEKYATFNDFFIRHLKPGIRPLANTAVTSPVDGYLSEFGDIKAGRMIQAKGIQYSVQELLAGSADEHQPYINGKFATLYLSPKNYHRVHMPMDAILKHMVYIPGKLFSVQPATTRVIRKLFARNERLVVHFETNIGAMAMVLVGATIVGGIGTRWQGDVSRGRKKRLYTYSDAQKTNVSLSKGDEMGYFKLGSTVILLFSDTCHLQWEATAEKNAPIQLGDALGHLCPSSCGV